MANVKFSELTALGNFVPGVKIVVLDTNDPTMSPSGTNKIMTAQNLLDVLAFTGASTGALTGAFYPRVGNPSGFLQIGDLSPYATIVNLTATGASLSAQIAVLQSISGGYVLRAESGQFVSTSVTGSQFYPRLGNPSGFILPAQTGQFVGTATTGLYFYPLTGNPSNFISSAQTGAFASDLELSAAISALSALYYPLANNPSGFILPSQTGQFVSTAVSGLHFYPRGSNPAGYLTGLIAGTNITVSSNGVGGWTINSTASGSSSTGALTGAFYPLVGNPSGFIQSTTGATILNGQLLIGSSGDNAFIQGGLTAGSGISIFSGSGQLVINSVFTGVIAGSNVTVSNNGLGGWTVNSTATGSGGGGTGDVTTTGVQTLSNKKNRFNAAFSSNNSWDGLSIFGLNAGATVAQWAPVYLGASSTWLSANHTGVAASPARGLAVAAYSSGNAAEIMTQGTVRFDSWSWTPGNPLYLSTGSFTQTAPTGSGMKVQVVGYALTSAMAYLDFNGEYITVQ